MTVIGAIVILLYASRACYNLVVLGLSNKSINSFDYDWYNVSDQVSQRDVAMLCKNGLDKNTNYCLAKLVGRSHSG